MYRATTGAMPFTGKDTLSTLAALTSETPREPHELNPSVPLAFSDLIMALLEKDKTLRPQTARDLVTALEGIEQGAIVAALSPHVAEDDVPLAQIANAVVAQPLPVASLRTVEATEAVQPSRMLTDKADPAVSDKGTRVLWLQSMTVSSLRKMLRTLGSMVGIRRSAAPSVKTEPVEAHS